MSAVAAFGGDGRRSRDGRVRAIAREAGSGLVLCRPRTPQAKGKDESANRLPARLRAYEGDFEGWDGPGATIARVCRRRNEGPNRTTGLPPELLFRREKETLGPLLRDAVLSELVGEVSWQVVPPTMLVRAAGREFSVLRRCVGHRAGLQLVPGGQPGACDGGDLVATHDTTAQGGPVVYREGDYLEAMADRCRGGTEADIEEQTRRILGLLGRLGGGEESRRGGGSFCERIRNNLEKLGPGAMATSAAERSRLVAGGAKPFPDALLEMTDAQVAAVGECDLDRRARKASFPYARTLRDFDFSFQSSIPRGVVGDLTTLGFPGRHENVMLVGSPGVGKTRMAGPGGRGDPRPQARLLHRLPEARVRPRPRPGEGPAREKAALLLAPPPARRGRGGLPGRRQARGVSAVSAGLQEVREEVDDSGDERGVLMCNKNRAAMAR